VLLFYVLKRFYGFVFNTLITKCHGIAGTFTYFFYFVFFSHFFDSYHTKCQRLALNSSSVALNTTAMLVLKLIVGN
jgi:hypothetical protein